MEVTLSADLQARLTRIARDRGTDAQALAREAIERLVDHDDWFVREIEKGLARTGHRVADAASRHTPDTPESRPSTPLPYVIVYTVLGDVIFVVRILHGAQRWP